MLRQQRHSFRVKRSFLVTRFQTSVSVLSRNSRKGPALSQLTVFCSTAKTYAHLCILRARSPSSSTRQSWPLIVIPCMIRRLGLPGALALFLCAIPVAARSMADGPIGSDAVVYPRSCLSSPCSASRLCLCSSLELFRNTFPDSPDHASPSRPNSSRATSANFAASPVIKPEAPSSDTNSTGESRSRNRFSSPALCTASIS